MPFSSLSWRARAYLFAVYLFAASALGVDWLLSTSGKAGAFHLWPWWRFVMLVVAASIAHSFPVSTPDRQAFHVSPPFFIAAIVLMPPLQVAALVVVVHIAEQIRRQRTWYGQLFNACQYLIAATTAQVTYQMLWARQAHELINLGDPRCYAAGVLAVLLYFGISHLLVMLAIWLANGIPPRQQHLDRETLLTDVLLLGLGLPGAQLSLVSPWAWLLGAAPLVVIHRALDLPNVRAQGRKDALTQLHSVPSFMEAVHRELIRAQRYGRPLTVLVLDIDRLSATNASYGRQAGNAVIRGTAALVDRMTRGFDIAARVAGGEFAVLLPETALEEGMEIAERIRAAVEAQSYDIPSSLLPVSITVSVGGAATTNSNESPQRLFDAALAAMGAVKGRGGNGYQFVAAGAEQDAAPRVASAPVQPAHTAAAPAATSHGSVCDGGEARVAAAGDSREDPTDVVVSAECERLLPAADVRLASSAAVRFGWLSWLPPAMQSRLSWSVLYQALIALVALAVVASAVPHMSTLDGTLLVLLVCFVGFLETRSVELFGRASYSISIVPCMTAAMLLGVPGAVIVAPFSAVIRGVQRRSRWNRVVFNACVYVLATAASAAVFHLTSPPLAPRNLAFLLAPATVAGLAYYLHTFLVATAMALDMRQSPLRVWREQFRWLWAHYPVLGALALLLGLAYHEFGVAGAAAFLVPPLMMHYVSKQYLDKTLQNVRQLRSLNEKLGSEIAQREAAEQENARLAEEAARAHALEELNRLKSEFISVASHELRTPMTAILGFSELMLDDVPEESPLRETAVFVHDEALQLSSLVDNLLDVSRIENGRLTVEPMPVDLSDTVLPPLLHALGASAPNHQLIADLAPDAQWVLADIGKLNQILTNLISNAIKYSPAGGPVYVRSCRDAESGRVLIAVQDAGIGISTDQLERIFDRFYRVRSLETRSVGGTGLGLYIARHLVELHGGRLWAESAEGQGSTFCFTLEAVSPAPEDDVSWTAREARADDLPTLSTATPAAAATTAATTTTLAMPASASRGTPATV